jgi:hypothetical protein
VNYLLFFAARRSSSACIAAIRLNCTSSVCWIDATAASRRARRSCGGSGCGKLLAECGRRPARECMDLPRNAPRILQRWGFVCHVSDRWATADAIAN